MVEETLKERLVTFHRAFKELTGFQRKEEGDRTRLAVDRPPRVEFNIRESDKPAETRKPFTMGKNSPYVEPIVKDSSRLKRKT
jgi:hypothetical protein